MVAGSLLGTIDLDVRLPYGQLTNRYTVNSGACVDVGAYVGGGVEPSARPSPVSRDRTSVASTHWREHRVATFLALCSVAWVATVIL